MDWDAGKQRHLELADKAAGQYQDYVKANRASAVYTDAEWRLIERRVDRLAPRSAALDLGTGEGRLALSLSPHFEYVSGLDFSARVLEAAEAARVRAGAWNVHFELRDIETSGLVGLANESLDLVVGGFGFGSFVQDLDGMLGEIRRVLRPGGEVILSFYNEHAWSREHPLLFNLDHGLGAELGHGRQRDMLAVDFGGEQFDIAARAYSRLELTDAFRTVGFDSEVVSLIALTLIVDPKLLQRARFEHLLAQAEAAISTDPTTQGTYLLVMGRKLPGNPVAPRTDSLRQAPWATEVQYRVHHPVTTGLEALNAVDSTPDHALVSLVIEAPGITPSGYALCCLNPDRQLDLEQVAMSLGVPVGTCRLASEHTLQDLAGLKRGEVGPFQVPLHVPVLIDEGLFVSDRGGVVGLTSV